LPAAIWVPSKTRSGAEATRHWQVLGENAVESRFEALRGLALSPVIGRDEEIDLLLARWARAQTGNGQIVLIAGEPGIGKSRLLVQLATEVANEPHTRLRCQCSPYHRDSVPHPFVVQLGRAARLAPNDPPETQLDGLEAILAPSPIMETVPLLAALLSIPTGGRYPPLALSAAQQRRLTLAALLDQLEALSPALASASARAASRLGKSQFLPCSRATARPYRISGSRDSSAPSDHVAQP
jgi:hypothetical protein